MSCQGGATWNKLKAKTLTKHSVKGAWAEAVGHPDKDKAWRFCLDNVKNHFIVQAGTPSYLQVQIPWPEFSDPAPALPTLPSWEISHALALHGCLWPYLVAKACDFTILQQPPPSCLHQLTLTSLSKQYLRQQQHQIPMPMWMGKKNLIRHQP